jgi:dolichyl-phosphate beta-glucosyltransferase
MVPGEFIDFLRNKKNIHIIFCNDGSTDSTQAILESIKQSAPDQVQIINSTHNVGKAMAVRSGILAALTDTSFEYAGYLDGDLSVSFDEFLDLLDKTIDQKVDFAFGSRVKMFNTNIQRNFFRHIIGRTITTILDLFLKLGIYDTQCGAKIFTCQLAGEIFKEEFTTRWLFDTEIFIRIKQSKSNVRGLESPLKTWIARRGSKIKISHYPRIIKDIFTLIWKYRTKKNS